MRKTLLTAVSAFAIVTASASLAFADTAQERTHNQDNMPTVTQQELKKGWKDTKETVSDAVESTSDAITNTYEDVKETLADNDNSITDVNSIKLDENTLASDILGQPVYNVSGDRVAKVHDIILDKNGHVQQVILADGDYTGMGKLVAYEYDMIDKRDQEGNIIAPLNEDMVDKAVEFSYTPDVLGIAQEEVLPNGTYSVSKLIENGTLVDPKGEELAQVQDIVIENGHAEKLVLSYAEIMGLGGERASIPYYDANVTLKDNEARFELSNLESQQFKDFKKTTLQ